ncbi:hemolysin secretion protein D [Luteitalea sp. TBR-22]|uniref:HlyD family secretion protein n=1 Tax=Luteitalea sp. TBR-22 TaxID=2802971 RepID=UPI001AFC7D8B|nr:HlyD family efflux transporter periplasmic adaptor subunit [Luteitalea sp. TBR-22]BCS32738.1 hemolysin secretion protein D [Luteitalea sp. TBR-22]
MNRPSTVVLTVLVLTLAGAACRRGPVDERIHLNGRIEAPLVDVAPRIQGRVLEVLVREGDRVKAGDLLIRLDLAETALAPDRDAQAVAAAEARVRDLASGSRAAEIAAAEAERADRAAALSLAREELARQQQLRSTRVGTQRDLDRARSDVTRAEAAVESATQRLTLVRQGFRQWQTRAAEAELGRAQRVKAQSDIVVREAELRAPSDAVVLHRLVEPGALLNPGQPAVTLGLESRLYVRTFIPEPRLGQVRQGQAVQVQVDAFPGQTFPARVTEISPSAEFTPKAVETRAERVNLVYAAKVDLDAGWKAPLVPGQPAEVLAPPPTRGAQ